jgi:peptide/nickel transport system permease protein
LLAFVGAQVWKYDYRTVTPDASQAPSWEHPSAPTTSATTTSPRCCGAPRSRSRSRSIVALLATFLGVLIGSDLRLLPRLGRHRPDAVRRSAVDHPVIAIAACLGRTLGGGDWRLLAFILAAVLLTDRPHHQRRVPLLAREGVRRSGASHRRQDRRIIFKHMLPNVVGPVIVSATLVVATAILYETALSYLGLGVKRPDTSLGLLVSDFQRSFQTRPWLFWFLACSSSSSP